MRSISSIRTIHAPADKVWQVISDYYNVHTFHPFVERTSSLNKQKQGIGASRKCHLYNGLCVTEEVIEWQDGRSFTVKSLDAPFVKQVTGGLAVKAIGDEKSVITAHMQYAIKWNRAGKLLDYIFFRFAFRYPLKQVLKSLEQHIKTGEIIGKNGKVVT